VDVNKTTVGIAVPGLNPIKPQNAGDNGVPAGGIDGKDFSSEFSGFEDSSRPCVLPDFFLDAHFANRGGIAARDVTESKFGC